MSDKNQKNIDSLRDKFIDEVARVYQIPKYWIDFRDYKES